VDEALAKAKNQTVTTSWLVFTIKPREQLSADLAKIMDAIVANKLNPVVDRVFPLSEAAEAHRYIGGRNQFGKVLLRP
jgi:NADPH:quinone reductase-like Zn-dependent oxidoreductase